MKRAFSLMEVLVSIVLLSVITVGIYDVLLVADKTYRNDMGLSDLQQQTRLAMSGMVKELRQTNASNITINLDGDRIDFKVPEDISTNPVTYSDVITYYFDNNQVIREYPAGTTRILGNDIDSLSFCCENGGSCNATCGNADVLQVQLAAQKTVMQQVLSFPLGGPLTEKVRLRNE